ncbi:hypothetical protein MHYP_G00269730 [Metynnis hypsauchen]
MEMDDTVAKIPLATSDIPVTTMVSSDVSETNNAMPEISLDPTETQVTTLVSNEEVNEISMVEYDTIVEILTASLKAAVHREIFADAKETKAISQKFSTVSLDSSAVVQKQHGESPGQVEKEEAQTEGAETPPFTLSFIREQQLMNRGCFTELWWMRESADWGMKASLLMEFIEAAAATNPDFTVDTQNDAHEFLFHVLSQMQQIGQMLSCVEGMAYDCPVSANFEFQLTSTITCGGCGAQKSSKVDFNHLSLALPAQGSVKDCIRLFFSVCLQVGIPHTAQNSSSAAEEVQLSSAFTILKQHNRVHIDSELQLTLPVQRVSEDRTHKETKPPDHLGLHTPPNG